jgi:anti-anti-sigma regulatory factor
MQCLEAAGVVRSEAANELLARVIQQLGAKLRQNEHPALATTVNAQSEQPEIGKHQQDSIELARKRLSTGLIGTRNEAGVLVCDCLIDTLPNIDVVTDEFGRKLSDIVAQSRSPVLVNLSSLERMGIKAVGPFLAAKLDLASRQLSFGICNATGQVLGNLQRLALEVFPSEEQALAQMTPLDTGKN